jgi:hypothetical protein|tara:strand:+ start:600 stop:719 length:120 start_codon:yes stop_codon:yes gene_type:complete
MEIGKKKKTEKAPGMTKTSQIVREAASNLERHLRSDVEN